MIGPSGRVVGERTWVSVAAAAKGITNETLIAVTGVVAAGELLADAEWLHPREGKGHLGVVRRLHDDRPSTADDLLMVYALAPRRGREATFAGIVEPSKIAEVLLEGRTLIVRWEWRSGTPDHGSAALRLVASRWCARRLPDLADLLMRMRDDALDAAAPALREAVAGEG